MDDLFGVKRCKADLTILGRGAFDEWLKNATKGERAIYWVGETASGFHKVAAFEAATAGYVHIFQQRVGHQQFAYVAERTRRLF